MIVTTIAFGGHGICRDEGHVIFVPFTAPQDEIDIEITEKKKRFAFGKIKRIIKPSGLRVIPLCPYFTQCGGCQFQHIDYAAQLEIKRTFIQDALQRIGNLAIPVPPVVPSPQQWHYRKHIRLNIKKSRMGYIGADQQTFIPITQCPIFSEYDLTPIQELISHLSSSEIEQASLRLFKDPNLLIFSFPESLPDNWQICEKPNSAWEGILLHSPTETRQFGTIDCTLNILGLKARFSPFGFIQNNQEQSIALYTALLNAVPQEATKILDLYCGIGITSLLLAQQKNQVIGIESHPETVALSNENKKLNNIENVEFILGTAEENAPSYLNSYKPDAIICNPPRTGIDRTLIQDLIASGTPTILYVSCMPATLARDTKLFIEGGYEVASIQGFDLFPQTTHLETLLVLKKSL